MGYGDNASRRQAGRVASEIQRGLTEVFLEFGPTLEWLRGVVITHVRIESGGKQATVFCRHTAGDADSAGFEKELKEHAGMLRKRLGSKLRIRTVPKLFFRWDLEIEQIGRIEELCREIESES